jgi:toxin ParE1/3/4
LTKPEFYEEIAYLDAQTERLGDKFIEDVEAAVRLICDYPESGYRISRNVRRSVLLKFRYDVLYVNARSEVIIVAIAAHRRRPNYWLERLRSTRHPT